MLSLYRPTSFVENFCTRKKAFLVLSDCFEINSKKDRSTSHVKCRHYTQILTMPLSDTNLVDWHYSYMYTGINDKMQRKSGMEQQMQVPLTQQIERLHQNKAALNYLFYDWLSAYHAINCPDRLALEMTDYLSEKQ